MYGINWEDGEVKHKYKVGDRVRVVKDAWGETFPVGSFGHITQVLNHGVCAARDGETCGWFFKENQLAPTEQVQGRFMVGDRVRLIEDNEGGVYGRRGDTGVISNTFSESHLVHFDTFRKNGDGHWYVKINNLAPAFRPGDRVKLNKHRDLYAYGDRGTVKRVLGDNVEAHMDLHSAFVSGIYTFPADALDWVRDEPAPDCAGRKVEQDNEPAASEEPKPKFKAGDVVVYKDGQATRPKTIKGLHTASWSTNPAYEYEGGGWDWEESLVLYVPHIVALTKNGKPLPSRYPHVHASVADATAEAERLARNNPGQEFAVYQRVAGRQCAVSYEMKEVA